MATVLEKINEQRTLKAEIERFASNLSKSPKDRLQNLGHVQGRVEALDKLHQLFLDNDRFINRSCSDEDKKNPYFDHALQDQFTERFYELKGTLNDLVIKLTPHSPRKFGSMTITPDYDDVPPLSSSQTPEPPHGIKLPHIMIPKFGGDYFSWLAFHDMFTSIVHSNTRVPPVQKMHYLKTCLVGEAEKLLRHLNITEDNYPIAWDLLCTRYQNTGVLVNQTLKALFSQPQIQSESARAIRQLIDRTKECLATLNTLKIKTDEWDPIINYLSVEKLPRETRQLWEQLQGTSTTLPHYSKLRDFLEARFRTLEAIPPPSIPKTDPHAMSKNTVFKHHAFHLTRSTCALCKGSNHTLRNCLTFKRMNTEARRKFVCTKSLCLNCLAHSHITRNCPSKNTCNVCRQRHNTLLHPPDAGQELLANQDRGDSSTFKEEKQIQPPSPSRVTCCHTRGSTEILLATVLLKASSPKGETLILRALLDPGSQATFITKRAAQTLRLTPRQASVQVSGLMNTLTANANSIVELVIQPQSLNTPRLQIQAIPLRTLTDLLPPKKLPKEQWKHLHDLHLADPMYDRPGHIDMVLGAEIYAAILQEGLVRSVSGAPTAQKTSFGWILLGECKSDQANCASTPKSMTTTIVSLCCQVEGGCNMLRRFWEIEEVDIPREASATDELCEKLYAETHSRTPEGRYIVKLPFKPLPETEAKFGSSREGAIRRFSSLKLRFDKDPQLHKEYHECLQEYLEEGHMEKVASSQLFKPNDRIFYLPHHAIQKSDSLTTKTRVVFDASARSSNGYSLNDRLLAGPALQRDISLLLFEWRQRRFVFTADIARMYRQILVDDPDSEYQRIIWQSNLDQSPEDYRLRTVTFGVSSAPFLAIRSLHQLAKDEEQNFPIGAKILLQDFYVDDLFSGGNTLSETLEARRQIDSLLRRGKFELRKWAANHKGVLTDILEEQRTSSPSVLLNKENMVKTLGLHWIPKVDCFKYVVQPISIQPSITKRQILSTVARIYDPLGLLSPIVISSKILLQDVWQRGLEWDQPVPEDIAKRWLEFLSLLPHITTISIPRFLEVEAQSSVQIHGFCDASQKAYGAALYMRSETNGTIRVHLISAKTRVAPVKSITLPRLELCGAVLLSRLMKKFLPSVKPKGQRIYAWTDSTIVLSWLQRHPNTLKTFVSNRVSEIVTNLGPISWNHVSSPENPADYATRGISSIKPLEDQLWWHGPQWLAKSNNCWPKNVKFEEPEPAILEIRPIKSFLSQGCEAESVRILQRFSSSSHLLKVTALCKEFIRRCRNKGADPNPSPLSTSQLNESRTFWMKHEQRRFFSEEIDCLTKSKTLNPSGKLLSLNPFVDTIGLLRVGGRLAHSDLPYNEKHPVIMHPDSHLTHLFIRDAHALCLHGGLTLTLSLLRKTMWIINGRKTVKKLIHQCIPCFRNACKVRDQLMGSLPPARVKITRPFTKVGIDYAGPFSLRMSHTRGCRTHKGYIAIFVCLCIKAVHIEVVSDLTTKAFLAAFTRFVARRGLCRDVYSDCGTTFIGAHNQLEKEIRLAIKEGSHHTANTFSVQGICWHFIPPAAPHFGGLWEAGVKSIKYHLKRISGNVPLTYEEMTTLLTQVEACLNSRPLCPLTDDINDTRALTPGHFLIGDALLAPPEEDLIPCKLNVLNRWNLVQRLKQEFWRSWSSEYLARLQQRPKWLKSSKNVKVGDLVLIKSDNLPSNQWALGRIIQVHPGDDHLIRVVTIKTQNGEYKRPITKICLLPMGSSCQMQQPKE